MNFLIHPYRKHRLYRHRGRDHLHLGDHLEHQNLEHRLEHHRVHHLDVEQIHLGECFRQHQLDEELHLDEKDHQHQLDEELHLDVCLVGQVYPCLGYLRKDCFPVLPLGEEFPCPELRQKDCFLHEEYLQSELLVQQVLLVQPPLPEQDPKALLLQRLQLWLLLLWSLV